MREKISRFLKKNEYLFWVTKYFFIKGLGITTHIMTDEQYLRIQYRLRTGKKLNLHSPKTFNEKMQYFKLYSHSPVFHQLSDKYEVRKYVAEKIGTEYLNPIYGVYDSIDEVNFDSLPQRFVMKLSNGSGYNSICTNKSKQEIRKIKKLFSLWQKTDCYVLGREWIYKGVKNRIICEKYIDGDSQYGLIDYKVFCFSGEPRLIQVDYNRYTDHKRNLYTPEWNFINETMAYSNDSDAKIDKPLRLTEMLECARKLSKGFAQVRVDFYAHDDRIIFGEMTFSHGAGYLKFSSEQLEKMMGDWWEL